MAAFIADRRFNGNMNAQSTGRDGLAFSMCAASLLNGLNSLVLQGIFNGYDAMQLAYFAAHI
ncbi:MULTISPECIES: hypothetical protein [Agrobacterium]|uniref:hypothetical protein n=1 Tax=Agrobacterium TaxID=357 RepID=UPI00174C17AE|nr:MULTISPECIES: hypothetical protein [Agrobacterium]MCZ7888342.1 hypothetical protein [Agrobacterium salinitolerans]MDA5630409.1 hypothetical protein [Agrobacterium sp. ST15.16.055]MDA6981306.1 hypothetical protein [Agrobacterium salinitolerans]